MEVTKVKTNISCSLDSSVAATLKSADCNASELINSFLKSFFELKDLQDEQEIRRKIQEHKAALTALNLRLNDIVHQKKNLIKHAQTINKVVKKLWQDKKKGADMDYRYNFEVEALRKKFGIVIDKDDLIDRVENYMFEPEKNLPKGGE